MDDSSLKAMIEKYKKELMETAKRNGVLGRPEEAAKPVQAEPVTAAAEAAAEEVVETAAEAEITPAAEALSADEALPVSADAAVLETAVAPMDPVPPTPENNNMAPDDNGPIVNPPETEELAPEQQARIPRENYADFIARTPGQGSLKIQANMANFAYPTPGVKIVVTKNFLDGTHTFYESETDEDGIVDNLLLPAPPKSVSQDPNSTVDPFSVYDVTATKPGFREEKFIQVPIFDGVKSIQPVRMVPKGV